MEPVAKGDIRTSTCRLYIPRDSQIRRSIYSNLILHSSTRLAFHEPSKSWEFIPHGAMIRSHHRKKTKKSPSCSARLASKCLWSYLNGMSQCWVYALSCSRLCENRLQNKYYSHVECRQLSIKGWILPLSIMGTQAYKTLLNNRKGVCAS